MVEYIEKRKPWESMFSRLLVVDDQGLECDIIELPQSL